MGKKTVWGMGIVLLLALVGGLLYYILNKKYYPKVEGLAYLKLELANDTAQVKAGINVQNRIPLPIAIDSVNYTITEEQVELGHGQMTDAQKLPALGDKVLDFRMLLDFGKYRSHLQEQQQKDSIRLDVKTDIFFDLPLISQTSTTLHQHLTVPVPKAPSLQLQDVVVRSFSPEEGYSFLLKVDATNRNLPDLRIKNFQYDFRFGDSLTISGEIDSTFHIQKGNKLLDIPLRLKFSDAVALLNKVLSGDNNWQYDARLEAQIESDHRLFEHFRLTMEKEGTLNMGSQVGARSDYLPTIRQVKRLEINADGEQTRLQAEVVVHNPAPLPFYIDSAAYFIRHNGTVIASGHKNYETTLPKSGDQLLTLRLLLDQSAYNNFMQQVQGQQQAAVDIELNLLYNLPNAERQRIRLTRQVQVPVKGQASVKVKDLAVRELSPQEGASLTLTLEVQQSNLPDLRIRNLDYALQLGESLRITGHTREPIHLSAKDQEVEVPIHLSAEDVNQLLHQALQGNTNWNYELQASAELLSSNDMIGPTSVDLAFSGELDMGGGMAGKRFVPQITGIDSLDVSIHFDTAWAELHLNVMNPLPVAFHIDSLLLTLSNGPDTFAISREHIGKVLPAEGRQSAWVTLAVNYEKWQQFQQQHQHDSLHLTETVTLAFRLENLPRQRATFRNTFELPTPDTPVAELKKVKLRGFSFTKGLLLQGLVEVKNLNVQKLVLRDLTYDACIPNLLDVCGTVNRTYHVPRGSNVVHVPMALGVGEVFRALIAKLTGGNRQREIFLNTSANVATDNPKLQHTFVRLEVWRKAQLFNKQQQATEEKPPQTLLNKKN